MKLNTFQNRREFFKCSFNRGLKYLGSVTGIIISQPNLIDNSYCDGNLSCYSCHKMGICEKEEAERARADVKRDSRIIKRSKGASNV